MGHEHHGVAWVLQPVVGLAEDHVAGERETDDRVVPGVALLGPQSENTVGRSNGHVQVRVHVGSSASYIGPSAVDVWAWMATTIPQR